MKVIEVTISPQGETKLQTRGFHGPDCRHASKFLEEALGQPIGEQLTGEFYQASAQQQEIRQ